MEFGNTVTTARDKGPSHKDKRKNRKEGGCSGRTQSQESTSKQTALAPPLQPASKATEIARSAGELVVQLEKLRDASASLEEYNEWYMKGQIELKKVLE